MSRVVFLALVAPLSNLGYVLDTSPNECPAWRNWAKRRGQRILGEFATQRQARERVSEWLLTLTPYQRPDSFYSRFNFTANESKYGKGAPTAKGQP